MLHEFLLTHRDDLIDACRRKVATRSAPRATAIELEHGIPVFMDQLIAMLATSPHRRGAIWPVTPGARLVSSQMESSATLHGAELLRHEFSIDQVVHDYGDLCQAITELAMERAVRIEVSDFQVLNRALDTAIADAVTQYSLLRTAETVEGDSRAEAERLGHFAHELRNLLHTATLALTAIKSGNVALSGATGAVLDRSLIGLQNLIDRSLGDVRARAGLSAQKRTFALSDFIADVKVAATLEARAAQCAFYVAEVDPRIRVHADRDLLMSAVGNLLQNGFKFSRRPAEVGLTARACGARVLIDVSDACGGLPAGFAETLFQPFRQASEDRSGLGLGLAIVKRSVEANGGVISVRDRPCAGCTFTIDLPLCTEGPDASEDGPREAATARRAPVGERSCNTAFHVGRGRIPAV